jgi:hypothetical protein
MLPRQCPVPDHLHVAICASSRLNWAFLHEFGESKVFPRSFFGLLGGSLDTECCVLVGDNIVFVFGVQRLVLGRHKYLVIWKLVLAEVLEEIGISRTVEVYICVVGVFGLWMLLAISQQMFAHSNHTIVQK